MFIKLTQARGHRYAQLVESFRNDQGQTRQRTLATLGRLGESGGQLETLLKSLQRATGQSVAAAQVAFESALPLGDVWALHSLWKETGFDQLAAVFRRARYCTAVEHAIRVMVFNRLCDLGLKRPSETEQLPLL
jgi:hypothetical protein